VAKFQVGTDAFDGGLNTKAQALNVPLHQLVQADNIVFDDYGAFKTRKGSAKLNSDSLGAAVVDGVFSYKPSTMSAQLVAVCNGRAAVATGAATAFNDIASSVTVWTANTPIEMKQQNELLFFSNGNVKPYKFNGNEFTQMGVSAPSGVLTVATNATAGNLTGSYTWVYLGVNSYLAEGDYNSASVTHAAVGESVVVGSIVTAPVSAGISYWKVYRNTAQVEGAYWYLTDVSNGVTSFTDNVADSSLENLAPTDNGQPRFFKYMFPANGRMWGAGDSNKDYLWYSNINQPEQFPAVNFIRVGRGDGLDISGIVEQDGNIVISKSDFSGRTAVYVLQIGDPTTNSDPANWYLKKFADDVGSDSHRAMVNYSGLVTMLNHDAIHAWKGGGVVINPSESIAGTTSEDSISDAIEPDVLNLAKDYLKNACAITWENRVWFSVPSSGNTINDIFYVYDFVLLNSGNRKKGAWSKFIPSGTNLISQFATHEDKLYGSKSSVIGHILQLDTGTADGLDKITATAKTAPYQGKKGHEDNWKDFRWIYITVDTAAYSIVMTTYIDTLQVNTYSIDLTAAGAEATKIVKVRLGNEQGRNIQFKYNNSAIDQPYAIRKIELVYNLRGLRN